MDSWFDITIFGIHSKVHPVVPWSPSARQIRRAFNMLM
jgi:hypothetical protein